MILCICRPPCYTNGEFHNNIDIYSIMPIWSIRCYLSGDRRNQIKGWYDLQSASVQAHFDSAMSYLVSQPRTAWVRPKATRLSGNNNRELYEIRFKAGNKQIRPLGYFGPHQGEFTILFCALEKGNEFVPKDACEQAEKRRKKVDKNKDDKSCRCFCTGSGFDCC